MSEFNFTHYFLRSIIACAAFGIIIGVAFIAACQILTISQTQVPVKYVAIMLAIIGAGCGWAAGLIAICVSTIASWLLMLPVFAGGGVAALVFAIWFHGTLPPHAELPLFIGAASYIGAAAVEFGSELQ